MSQYRITAPAARDLEKAYEYTTEQSVRGAAKLVERMTQAFRTLARQPGLGRPRDEIAPGLRSFRVGSYLVFYEARADGILIVRVLHGARHIERLFTSDDY